MHSFILLVMSVNCCVIKLLNFVPRKPGILPKIDPQKKKET